MQFVLTIELGNDAMQTPWDVAEALDHQVRKQLRIIGPEWAGNWKPALDLSRAPDGLREALDAHEYEGQYPAGGPECACGWVGVFEPHTAQRQWRKHRYEAIRAALAMEPFGLVMDANGNTVGRWTLVDDDKP